MSSSEQRMASLTEQLRQSPDIASRLPREEAAIVAAALDGASVHAIAQDHGISTEAVWSTLGNAARLAVGTATPRQVEVGGLGSDTDPGIHGGYGDTGFGALGAEPPVPDPEEPHEGAF